MIYSHFGNEIEITAVLKWDGDEPIIVEALRLADLRTKHFNVNDLRATNGQDEIKQAIRKVASKEGEPCT